MVTFNLQQDGIYTSLLNKVFEVLMQDLHNSSTLKYTNCIADTQVQTPDEEKLKIVSYRIPPTDNLRVQHTTLNNIIKEILIILKEEGNYTDRQMHALNIVLHKLNENEEINTIPNEHIILYTDTESLELHLNDSSITFIYHFTGQW